MSKETWGSQPESSRPKPDWELDIQTQHNPQGVPPLASLDNTNSFFIIEILLFVDVSRTNWAIYAIFGAVVISFEGDLPSRSTFVTLEVFSTHTGIPCFSL